MAGLVPGHFDSGRAGMSAAVFEQVKKLPRSHKTRLSWPGFAGMTAGTHST
jgi:hypothetical protein